MLGIQQEISDVHGNNKIKYRQLCKSEITIPIFSKDWWLDAVAGESWDVALVENGHEIIASMPYVIKRRAWYNMLYQPQLTQNLGPWIRPSNVKYVKQLSREKDLMEELIKQLPSFGHFSQNWHYLRSNWLPFYWHGFSQTTRYTYVIDDITDMDTVFSNFDHSKRKNIKKALDMVEVRFDMSAEDFYQNHKLTLSKQGLSISYGYSLFKRIYDSAYARGAGRIIAAYDANNNLHAALFIVLDDMSAYDLISTIDTDYRSSGSASLLVYEAIKYCKEIGLQKFDFEGSMLEPVERSFRLFGAIQKPYFSISKTPSKMLKSYFLVRELIKQCLPHN